MAAEAFPLAWPDGWPRTQHDRRSGGWNFKQRGQPDAQGYAGMTNVTLETARKKLFAELDRMRVSHVVLSTNVPLRADGMPRSDWGRMKITDPGAAVYFQWKGKPMVMACDRYDNVASNVRSLGLAIDAMRQLERHGGGTMMERAFSGFVALSDRPHWTSVLGVGKDADRSAILAAHRRKAREAHPDAGGTAEAMAALNIARDQALAEVGA